MRLHVGQGTTVGSLTLFPIWNDRPASGSRRYDTGTETLSVSEADGGPSVPQLLVTNTGKRPVLVLDGQLFEGGWQHRMATRSSLIGAESRAVLDVACVEQGRWGGEAAHTTRGRRASTFVRHGFDVGDQSEVWRRVEGYGGGSSTGSLVERMSTRDEQAELMLKRVRSLAGQAGLLVGIGGQPFALEVFDHPQTLTEQFEAIVRAACLDAYGRPALPTPGRRARRMIERLETTRLDVEPDVGQAAKLSRARTTDLDVMVLRQGLRTLHRRATYLRHPILVGA